MALVKDAQLKDAQLKDAQLKDNRVKQFDLATLYFLGEGVDRDLKEARRWFEMAYNSFPEGAERNAAGDILERLKAPLAEEFDS